MAKPQLEKRSNKRVRTDDTVAVKVLNGAVKDAQAQLHDVSMRGVFLYLQNRVTEGSTLEMVLPLPQGIMPGQEDWIRCKCRVVRVEKKGGPEYGVAALIEEFEPLEAAKLPQA
ncbi:MAG: PilZ domain-containing protein [Acidobacteriia bacterium]|nr:PilZ domain-containing protein [Terriglobia bacterium]